MNLQTNRPRTNTGIAVATSAPTTAKQAREAAASLIDTRDQVKDTSEEEMAIPDPFTLVMQRMIKTELKSSDKERNNEKTNLRRSCDHLID
jgi:hypothetical protein